jgi:hypothetical protein
MKNVASLAYIRRLGKLLKRHIFDTEAEGGSVPPAEGFSAPPKAERYVATVSYPRSGHHLLTHLLRIYFPELGYCLYYHDKNCCGKFPCARPGKIQLTKNHDFDNTVPKLRRVPYIIQYRDFLPAVVSDFELYLRNGHPDTQESFIGFAKYKVEYYRRFTSKWLADDKLEKLIIKYEDLIENGPTWLNLAVKMLAPRSEVDQSRIEFAIREVPWQEVTKTSEIWHERSGLSFHRKVEDFRHYDAGLFEELDALSRRGLSST